MAALLLFILLAIITVFGWYSVQRGVHAHHHDMEVLRDIENVFHEINSRYQNVKFSTMEFMIEPDKKHHHAYLQSLENLVLTFKKFNRINQGSIDHSFLEQLELLGKNIEQCRSELDQAVKVRLDAEKTFPFATIMLALNTDNMEILSSINTILQSSGKSDLPYNTKTRLSDIRYTWVRMMAEFRLLVSVRFGIFSGDWTSAYSDRVYNIELYIDKLDRLLRELKQEKDKANFSLEIETAIDNLESKIEDTVQYYRYAISMLDSPDWRQDIVLLGEKVRPAFEHLDSSFNQLHIKIEDIRTASMLQLTNLARQLSDSLWFLFAVGSLLILLGYIIFSRTILLPISQVAQALKDEAIGKKANIENYSSAQEIQNLTAAFDEMRRQVESRQQRLVNILDNAAEAIITIDKHGDIETFNAAAEQLFGYRSSEVLGRNMKMLVPDDRLDSYRQLLAEYLGSCNRGSASEPANAYKIDILTKSSRLIPVSIKISKTNIDGNTLYTALVIDISERLAREKERQEHIAEMAHAGRLSIMGEMAAGIAHELNQPLAAMSLYLQASLRRCDPDADTCKDIIKAVNASIQQVERTSEIIRKMRGFAHRETFHLEQADLNDIVRKSVDLVLISQQNVRPQPELVLHPTRLMVNVDVLQIEQVMVNLIRNAFDALQNTAEDRRILQIKTEVDNKGYARISVFDSGEGVAKENVDRIFDTYFTTKADGLGMGLSICRSIIEEHNGFLWYREREGGGSQFCFILPLANTEDEQENS